MTVMAKLLLNKRKGECCLILCGAQILTPLLPSPWTRDKVIKHVHQQLFDGSVMAISGETIPINLEGREVSLCCHSDSPGW